MIAEWVPNCRQRAPREASSDTIAHEHQRRSRGASADLTAMNTLSAICPYKYQGDWVFGDEKVGLVQEPFVSGADAIIEHWASQIPNAKRDSASYSLRTPSRVSLLSWNGAGRNLVAIGTTAAI